MIFCKAQKYILLKLPNIRNYLFQVFRSWLEILQGSGQFEAQSASSAKVPKCCKVSIGLLHVQSYLPHLGEISPNLKHLTIYTRPGLSLCLENSNSAFREWGICG